MNPIHDISVWAVGLLPANASDQAIAVAVMAGLLVSFVAIGSLAGLVGYLATRREQ